MKISKLEELRNIHLEIKAKNSKATLAEIQNDEIMVLNAMDKITELSQLARREGLLALEDAVWNIPLESEEEELRQLIMLLVDGTEPTLLEGIGMARYYTSLHTDYRALKSFLYLEGVLSIQEGENPRILEEKLKVMLPSHLYIQYSKKVEEKKQEEKKKDDENLIENLCKGERQWNLGENGYYISKLTDYTVCDLGNRELQRVMREIDNVDLTLAMKGMSGAARKRIFDNLSNRLGQMIAEDMISMGPVRAVDILEASQKILTVLVRLIDYGEIASKYEYLKPFYNTFYVETKSQTSKHSQISELKQLVEEYEQGSELVREIWELL